MKPNTAEPDWKEIRGWKNQLVHLLGTRGRVTARSRDGMPKPVSNATMEKREKRLFAALNELQRMGYKFKSLDSLQRRHIQALGMKWAKDGHAPSTIQNDLSMLRLLFQWIDKPEIMGESAEFVPSKQFVKRTTNAQYDHSWTAAGVDADRLIGLVSQYDRHVGIQLRLCHAFYLRRQEAVMFKPLDRRASTVQCLAQRDGSLEGPAGKERLDPTQTRRSLRRRSSGSLPSEPAVHRRLCTAGKYPSASQCAGRPLDGQRSGTVMRFGTSGENHRLSCTVSTVIFCLKAVTASI